MAVGYLLMTIVLLFVFGIMELMVYLRDPERSVWSLDVGNILLNLGKYGITYIALWFGCASIMQSTMRYAGINVEWGDTFSVAFGLLILLRAIKFFNGGEES